MVFEIVWTEKALHSYGANINYLQKEWMKNEVEKFMRVTAKTVTALSLHPYIGCAKNNRQKNVRLTVINKRISLVYRVKVREKRIELILFWNTLQNPQRLRSLV